MLRFISIDNYTLIDHLEVEFRPGLNLITGETGSGKSILVDAVGLLVGARASQEMVREGFDLARVEGIFALPRKSPVRGILNEGAPLGESDELIIRREISRSGTNRVFINGRLSTLNQLLELGDSLVNIHGQHEQQGLLQPGNHLEYLDSFGNNQALRSDVEKSCRDLQQTEARIQSIQSSDRERLQRRDLLQYQIKEISSLQLETGLEESLRGEKGLLSSAEMRSQKARESYDLLYERETSALSVLGQVSKCLADLAELDSAFSQFSPRMKEIYYQLEEIAFQARDYADNIEFSPARLEQVEERLAEIEKAKRKYGGTIEDILSYAREIASESEELKSTETEVEQLISQVGALRKRYLRAAELLSEKRSLDAARLAKVIEDELADLAMQDTRFEVCLEHVEGQIDEKGTDLVEFLISPNPGEPLRPLAKSASGGELSRVMLALKSVLKGGEIKRTLVFDEIDAGIGGRVAASLGEKLFRLSRSHQVFCVTHLPQVAARANQHFHVDKRTREKRTVVELKNLDDQERVEELSRMLAGDAVTSTTRRQAEEMISHLQRRKN